jgi:adenylate kinase
VPDDVTVGLWAHQIEQMEHAGRFKPESDYLVLDGIPRNVSQAKMLEGKLDVRHVFHLDCADKAKVYERLKRRALKENRLDDINEEVIERRQKVYERETEPVLDYYGEKLITNVNSDQPPFQVLRDILNEVTAWRE